MFVQGKFGMIPNPKKCGPVIGVKPVFHQELFLVQNVENL
jgi:hypothetical protein